MADKKDQVGESVDKSTPTVIEESTLPGKKPKPSKLKILAGKDVDQDPKT